MDGDAVVTTHGFASGVNSPNLGFDALSEAHRLAVGHIDDPTCRASGCGHQCA
jgi:hypothetical protein